MLHPNILQPTNHHPRDNNHSSLLLMLCPSAPFQVPYVYLHALGSRSSSGHCERSTSLLLCSLCFTCWLWFRLALEKSAHIHRKCNNQYKRFTGFKKCMCTPIWLMGDGCKRKELFSYSLGDFFCLTDFKRKCGVSCRRKEIYQQYLIGWETDRTALAKFSKFLTLNQIGVFNIYLMLILSVTTKSHLLSFNVVSLKSFTIWHQQHSHSTLVFSTTHIAKYHFIPHSWIIIIITVNRVHLNNTIFIL